MKDLFFTFFAIIALCSDWIVDTLNLYPTLMTFVLIIGLIIIAYVLIFWLPDKMFEEDNKND
jgi:uncharacterized membrane protein